MALRSKLVCALFAGALALSCASPTLPLPPPAVPSITPSTTPGKYHLSSERGVEPSAIVIIFNRNPSVPRDQRVSGAEADGAGSWDAEVVGSPGDYLDITEEIGTQGSPSITIQIPR